MPLYRFHLVGPHERIRDEAGLDLPDATAAACGAAALVAEVRADAAEHARWRGWTIEIEDEDGCVVAEIPFG